MDTIVRDLQSMHSTRVIYLSSFDLDVCLMLLHKQAMYPVFLLLGEWESTLLVLDDVSNCHEVSKQEWLEGSWKQYVKSALERGQFRGVVAAAELINEESVKWVWNALNQWVIVETKKFGRLYMGQGKQWRERKNLSSGNWSGWDHCRQIW